MNIIKLNATNSTNDYLKDLMRKQFVDNFTVVVAKDQQKGRGQREAEWFSEAGKNLTFSVLVKDLIVEASELFTLNIAVALSVLDELIALTFSTLKFKILFLNYISLMKNVFEKFHKIADLC